MPHQQKGFYERQHASSPKARVPGYLAIDETRGNEKGDFYMKQD